MVGTRKGLFLLRGDANRSSWELEGPLLTAGRSTTRPTIRATGRIYAAAQQLRLRRRPSSARPTAAETWKRSEEPRAAGGDRPEARGDLARRARARERAGHALPRRDPGRALPLRRQGRDAGSRCSGSCSTSRATGGTPARAACAATRSSSTRATPKRMYVGDLRRRRRSAPTTAARRWTPRNKNVAADFLPDPFPEVGQCVHKLLLHPARPDRLWQQNHCGVYRSDDARRRRGSGSTGTACRAASASRSCSTRATPTSRS